MKASQATKMLELGLSRLGEQYDLGADVPLDDKDWHGPWDCAEFTSWLVYQVMGEKIGCVDNDAPVGKLEPYSMAWYRDAQASSSKITIEDAKETKGAFLVRREVNGKRGHVAMSDGEGRTIEAMGAATGVARGNIAGRVWHVAFIP
jgi:hypothetical protein